MDDVCMIVYVWHLGGGGLSSAFCIVALGWLLEKVIGGVYQKGPDKHFHAHEMDLQVVLVFTRDAGLMYRPQVRS